MGEGWGGEAETQREEFMEEAECYGIQNGRTQTRPGDQSPGCWAKHFICTVLFTAALSRLPRSKCGHEALQSHVKQDTVELPSNPVLVTPDPAVLIMEQSTGLLWATPPAAELPFGIGGLLCCPQRRNWELACSVGNADRTQRNGPFSGAKQGYTQDFTAQCFNLSSLLGKKAGGRVRTLLHIHLGIHLWGGCLVVFVFNGLRLLRDYLNLLNP